MEIAPLSTTRLRPRFFVVLALCLEAALVLCLLVPSPIDSVAYEAPSPLEMKGPLAPNEALRTARVVGEGRLVGAEDVAVDAAGRLYTGTEDGRIVRVTLAPDGREVLDTLSDTGGRPLGLRFGPAGRTLFVADAKRGLLAVDEAGGIEPLAIQADGVPFGFTDDLDVAPDGTIYFSDASRRFGVDEYLHDLLEARPHGRLLRYDPRKGEVRVLLDGLYFANGVALARDQGFVLVNETYRYRIRRYWLRGPKAGTSDLFVEDLPGFPDNLSRDPATGRFWVALYTVRNPALDFLHPRPWLKNQLAKLPRFLWPKPEPYGLVLALDEQGRIVESLHDPGGESVRTVTSVEPHGGRLYLGSLHGPMAVWEPHPGPEGPGAAGGLVGEGRRRFFGRRGPRRAELSQVLLCQLEPPPGGPHPEEGAGEVVTIGGVERVLVVGGTSPGAPRSEQPDLSVMPGDDQERSETAVSLRSDRSRNRRDRW